ncbi:hypothetical protein D3C83_106220 [compost metagenome]
MISGSTSAFSLAQMAAGSPARALSISWSMKVTRSVFIMSGENDSFSSRSGRA